MGGAAGIFSCLVAIAGLFLHRLDQVGFFHRCEAQRAQRLSRVEAVLPFLALAFHGVNVGLGASPAGPGAEIGNAFISSVMCLILSLLLCERTLDARVPRVWPSRPHGAEDPATRGEGGGRHRGEEDSSESSEYSSSSSSSSCASLSSYGRSLRTEDSESMHLESGTLTTGTAEGLKPEIKTHMHTSHRQGPPAETWEKTPFARGGTTEARKDFIPAKSVQGGPRPKQGAPTEGRVEPVSFQSTRRENAHPTNENAPTTSEDDLMVRQYSDSTYSLPEPAPVYESSSQSPLDTASFPENAANKRAPPPPPLKPEFKPYADAREESESEQSGVQLAFSPEESISSLECSVATSRTPRPPFVAPAPAEPDGYKSDDAYTPKVLPATGTSARSRPSKKSRRKPRQQASLRKANRPAPLASVQERSVDTEPLGAQTATQPPPNSDPKQTVEQIMDREIQDKASVKPESTSPVSKKEEDGNPSGTQQLAPLAGEESSFDGSRGPPTIDPNQEDEKAIERS